MRRYAQALLFVFSRPVPLRSSVSHVNVRPIGLLRAHVIQGKPEAMILDGLDCVIDGKRAKVTVTVRPSKASLLAFKQVRFDSLTQFLNTTPGLMCRHRMTSSWKPHRNRQVIGLRTVGGFINFANNVADALQHHHPHVF